MNRKIIFFISVLALAATFLLGALARPVLGRIREAALPPPPDPQFVSLDPVYGLTDVEALINIYAPEDAAAARASLGEFLWDEARLSETMPARVDRNHADARCDDMGDVLERLDLVTVEMEFGIQSLVYHFIPRKGNGRLLIFHQGHLPDDLMADKPFIREALARGYAVAGFCMPLIGHNNQPVVDVERVGTLRLAYHDHLQFLRPARGHAARFFVEPVVVFLNYAAAEYRYGHVAMAGLSGGGWTTVLAAALDPRIRSSFPVAGSYPIFLKARRDWGDWEQVTPDLYRNTTYLEMYILGGFGEGRRQLQIVNQFDSCCFGGIKWQTYRDAVRGRVGALGAGEWDVFMDSSHREHKISDVARAKIFETLDAVP
jgi:hypothetical protein